MLVAAAIVLLSAPADAQDIRRIDDRSVTRDRYERAVLAVLEIEGQKVELVFQRETVPGAVFLTITTASRTPSTYRYLGQEGDVVRFRLTRGESVDAILTYASSAGRFVVIPEELQHTRLRFDLTPMAERGVLMAALLDNGQPR
jgi:hypothetical protein